jgi:rod shape-determining protein MreD
VVGQPSITRAALLVAAAAILEAVLSPVLTFGWVGPKFAVIGIVLAVAGQRELQALLLGFFGGVLTDALGGGLFGVGALGGLAAAAISMRLGASRRKKSEMRAVLTVASGFAVVAYDIIGLLALVLAGEGGPPLGEYLVVGVIPDALLNATLAYFSGMWLLRMMIGKEEGKEG